MTAIGLVLVIEGALYALFPGPVRRMFMVALTLPVGKLRLGGLVAAAFGVGLVWLARRGLA